MSSSCQNFQSVSLIALPLLQRHGCKPLVHLSAGVAAGVAARWATQGNQAAYSEQLWRAVTAAAAAPAAPQQRGLQLGWRHAQRRLRRACRGRTARRARLALPHLLARGAPHPVWSHSVRSRACDMHAHVDRRCMAMYLVRRSAGTRDQPGWAHKRPHPDTEPGRQIQPHCESGLQHPGSPPCIPPMHVQHATGGLVATWCGTCPPYPPRNRRHGAAYSARSTLGERLSSM